MGNKFRIHIGVLALILMCSCGDTSLSSYEAYLGWLDNVDNGLTMTKEAGGITIKVKHLPSNYLAYQDLVNESMVQKTKADSLIESYDKSLTFLLTIGVDGDAKKGDIMYQGVSDYEEYKKRLYEMNFDIENYISLNIAGKKYRPVLSQLENVYGLTDSRNITLVFVPETKEEKSFYEADEIKLTYNDNLFSSGINHFTFNRTDINNSPLFTFWN